MWARVNILLGFLLLRGWRGGLDLDSVNRVLEKDDEWESVDIKYVLVTTVGTVMSISNFLNDNSLLN